MSRVYEALCQSESEKGLSLRLFDPDNFQASTSRAEPPVTVTPNQLAWAEVRSVNPSVRDDNHVVTLTDGNGLGAEKFRLLGARLRNLRERQQLRKLVITSAAPGDGKTLVGINLAVCLAKNTTEKVLLLEGDLRRPMLAEQLGIRGLPGLGDWAAADQPISKYICRFGDLQLWVLPSGSISEDPVAILHSTRFFKLYSQLVTCFDWIIIDTPPLLPMADVNFWSRHVDGLLLVVRQGKTPKAVLKKGLETLDNPKVVGVIFNDAQQVETSYYQQYYDKSKT
jgi:succinoglycan biosynthesis transport protein ExoP